MNCAFKWWGWTTQLCCKHGSTARVSADVSGQLFNRTEHVDDSLTVVTLITRSRWYVLQTACLQFECTPPACQYQKYEIISLPADPCCQPKMVKLCNNMCKVFTANICTHLSEAAADIHGWCTVFHRCIHVGNLKINIHIISMKPYLFVTINVSNHLHDYAQPNLK